MNRDTKIKRFFIKLGLLLTVTVFFYLTANLLAHYLGIIAKVLLQSVKMQEIDYAVEFRFHVSCLFRPPAGMSIMMPVIISLMATSMAGYRAVQKITNRFFRNREIDGTSRWASRREIRGFSSRILKSRFKYQRIVQKEDPFHEEENHGSAPPASVVEPEGLIPPIQKAIVTVQKKISVKLLPAPGTIPYNPDSNLFLASSFLFYYCDKAYTHTLTIGGTQTGKTQQVVFNLIMAKAFAREHLIINDMKGELLEGTYALLTALGYDVQAINFREPNHSACNNELQIMIDYFLEAKNGDGDMSKVIEEVDDFAMSKTDNAHSEPIWPQSAASLLSAIILYMIDEGYRIGCLDKVNMYSVFNFFVEFGGKDIVIGNRMFNALDMIMSALPVGHIAKLSYAASEFAKGEMQASIFSTLANSLRAYKDTGVAKITGKTNLHFIENVKTGRPSAVFFVIPDEKKNRHEIAVSMIHQLFTQLVDYSYTLPGLKLQVPVNFVMDESGQAKIPAMANKVTVGLSRWIIWYLFVQNLSQYHDLYGDKQANTIISNCNNLIYVHSVDEQTNRYIESRLGKKTESYETFQKNSEDILDKSKSFQSKGRTLMDQSELSRLKEGEIIVFKLRQYPIKTKMPHFYKRKYPKTDLHTLNFSDGVVKDVQDILYPFDVAATLSNMEPQEVEVEKKDEPERKPVKVPIAKQKQTAIQNILNQCNLHTKGMFGKEIKNQNIFLLQSMVNDLYHKNLIGDKELHLIQNVFMKDLKSGKYKIY